MKIVTRKFKVVDFNDLGFQINTFLNEHYLNYDAQDIEIHKVGYWTYEVIIKLKIQ